MITNTYAVFVDGVEYTCSQVVDGSIHIKDVISGKEFGVIDGIIPEIDCEDETSLAFEKVVANHVKHILDGWELTDASCNQYRKTIVEDEIYLFREDRIIDPQTKQTEIFELEMNYNDYSWNEIISACESFGYDANTIDKWITEGEEIALMLECLFELEN